MTNTQFDTNRYLGHTEGPWWINHEDGDGATSIWNGTIDEGNMNHVADVDAHENDLKLMAEAPEILQALIDEQAEVKRLRKLEVNKKLPEGVDPKDIITKLVPRDFVGGSKDTGAWVFYQEGVFYRTIEDEDGQYIAIWHWTDGEYETDNDCDEIYKQKAKAGCLAWFATTEAAIRYAESLEVKAPYYSSSAPSNIYVEDRTGIAWERTAHRDDWKGKWRIY